MEDEEVRHRLPAQHDIDLGGLIAGDDLLEFVTEKATFNLPSPVSGILKEVFFLEGDVIEVGETLAVIE